VEGKAGETIVAEVARAPPRLPVRSFIKSPARMARSSVERRSLRRRVGAEHRTTPIPTLMVRLPADGKYFIHLGDTRRHAGKEYAYRLRISQPQRFRCCVSFLPGSLCPAGSAAVTVFAIRKDGFDGPIKLSFKDCRRGWNRPAPRCRPTRGR